MNYGKTITIDLSVRGTGKTIGEAAVSGDSLYRVLTFALERDGEPWMVPEGVRASLAYRTDWGAEGEYDTMPEGTDAAQIEGNLVTVRLVDTILARPGSVTLALVLRDHRMGRLSSHPMVMSVSRGLGDVPKTPVLYYAVRDLEQINDAIEALTRRVDGVDTEQNQTAAREARQAAQEAKEHAASIDTEQISRRIEQKGDDLYVRDGRLMLTSNGQEIGNGVELPESSGLAFDGGYVDAGNLLHLTMEGADIEGFAPIALPAGSGSTDHGSRLTVAMRTGADIVAAQSDEEVLLAFSFSSVDSATGTPTGNGSLQLTVDGVVKRTAEISQGDISMNIRPWLSAGANSVVLTITDSYGNSAVRRVSVTLESLSLEWSLGATARTDGVLSLHLTPIGNYTKTVHLAVDGVNVEVFEVSTSGRRITKSIPVQVHGGHIITAWAEMEAAGTRMVSEVLSCAAVWVTDGLVPAIACTQLPEELEQYATVRLVHRVIDPGNNPAAVQYLVNGALFREALVDQGEQVWTVRLAAAGPLTLTILCGDVRHDTNIQVIGVGADVQEVTDGLKLKVDPTAMADLADWSEGGYRFTLSGGFDQVNGGLCSDTSGVRCIRVTAGDRLSLNYPLFAQDARSRGLSAKIVYAVRDASAKHCTAISCLQGTMGLEIQANNVYLRGNQTICRLSTCEDEKTELDITIQPDSGDGIMHLWEGCSTFAYMKYAADESFVHTQAGGITFGCDDADVYIYLMRFYERDLTDAERLANHAADGADTGQILDRQERNDIYDSTGSIDIEKCASRNPDCHHIVISAERMTKGKSDEVRGTIRHIYRAGGPEHQWSAPVSMFVQGTSSVEHAETAGPNLNFYYPGGITLEDGTLVPDGYAMNGRDKSVPVLELCYKKNIASEDHIVNRACAEWYNRFQPSVRPERLADPRVRDCLDSCMCAVYFRNTGASAVQVGPDLVPPGATVFFGLGNLCSNKDSVAAFGYHPIVIEVKNNTEPQVRFKSRDLSGDNWKNNYEFRYLDTARYTEDQARAEWQRVQDFLYETDCTAATDDALPAAVTIGGSTYVRDSAAYRRARWLEEAPQIFDMQTLTFHHNLTLFLLLRDNRAKNMFWSYDPEGNRWGLWFNWDNDTGLCRNNDGYIDIEPGYMDFDRLGTADVFNGADNVLFVNLRTWEPERLRTDYLDRESAGCWDIDAFYGYAMESQEAVCEALWIEDAAHNAIRTMQALGTSAYLERATGRLRLHLRKALIFQKVMVDSWYCSTAAVTDSGKFRGYTPAQWAGVEPNGRITVTPYTNMYINVRAGNTDYRVRAREGEAVELDISASLNNTEMYFRHAPWLQDLGDLSGLYLGQFEASSLKRVRRLLIGSENPDYYNTNFTQASFDNCAKLETLNLGGLKNANRGFDFRPNLYLRDLYTRGSGVTGVTFARQGRLASARLNAVKSLSVQSLTKLEQFTMPTYANLTVLSVEDTPVMDTQAMAEGALGLERVRLLGIDWDCPNADTLMRLSACAGRDDDGRDIPQPIVTGTVRIASATEDELEHLTAVFPDLEIVCSSIVPSCTVRFLVEGQVVHTEVVARGAMVRDPVAAGVIQIPVKASSVEYHYSYIGWDQSLQDITEDRDLNAVFHAEDRYYIVRYWYDQTEEDLAREFRCIAHGSCTFDAAEPDREGAYWVGWDADAADVVSDLNIHPVFVTPVIPETVVEKFEYLYSDDPLDDSAYTLAEFLWILENGGGKTYFQIGDRIRIVAPANDIYKDADFVLQVCDFNHFRLAEGSGFAGVVFGMVGVMNAAYRMNATNTNAGGWRDSMMRTWLNDTVFPTLPVKWKRLIRTVEVRSAEGGTGGAILTSQDRLFLAARAETGFDAALVPHVNEIDPEAENVVMPVFTDTASLIRKTFNGEGSAQNWWNRTPDDASAEGFCKITSTGASTAGNKSSYASYSLNYPSWYCCMGVACV